ncbi:MAG: hypothetical protein LIO90_03770 [Bacteroidales bacterium]|nr:hypothetical protein [Bacteroidales bacterium]
MTLRSSWYIILVVATLAVSALMGSCRIEPPLHLPGETVEMSLPEIRVDINVIWGIEADWERYWYYGWDADDVAQFGSIEYPQPKSFQARIYYHPDKPTDAWTSCSELWVEGTKFTRRFDFGYHDLLLWSEIDSEDGTQVLIIDESDKDAIFATTSRSRIGAYNHPEIFYGGYDPGLYVSDDYSTYDYYDEERNVWVKNLETEVYPMVYIYLVQAIIYNNNGRVTGLTADPALSSLSEAVTIHTGRTSEQEINVAFPMRLKKGLQVEDRVADIFGGKLTTFGLCGMNSWVESKSSIIYSGSRADLRNHLEVGLSFTNRADSTYRFDVTPQLQRQAHGGVITVEIDVDTLPLPHITTTGGSSGFIPTIGEFTDSISHEFEM